MRVLITKGTTVTDLEGTFVAHGGDYLDCDEALADALIQGGSASRVESEGGTYNGSIS